MLGWRKRNDGFEWRDYVRTTILVRRRKRRDRVGEAGRAAVENLKVAGQRGAVAGAEGAIAVGRGAINLGQQGAEMGAAGAKAMGRGAVNFGQQGAEIGAAGAKAVGRGVFHYGQQGARLGAIGAKVGAAKVRAGVPIAGNYLQRFGAALFYAIAYTWAVVCTLIGIAADYLGPLLAPVGRFLRQPGTRLVALIVGAVALLGGIIRASANGFETDTRIALAIGIGLLGALAMAHSTAGLPSWLAAPLASTAARARQFLQAATAKPAVQVAFAVAVIAIGVLGSIYALRASPSSAPISRHARETPRPSPATSADLEGRGSALSGDTLKVGATAVRLNGIEAPLPDQTCLNGEGGQWPCGDAARQALARMLRSGRVGCSITGSTDGQSAGDCQAGGRDLAAELVRGGHVFASAGFFAPYAAQEREARAGKAGLWAGEAVRPAQYRERKWEDAKRSSPDGCPIKGSVRAGRRLYVLPWARGYEQARVVTSRGERWFCSETEAQQAGFRSAEQS